MSFIQLFLYDGNLQTFSVNILKITRRNIVIESSNRKTSSKSNKTAKKLTKTQ